LKKDGKGRNKRRHDLIVFEIVHFYFWNIRCKFGKKKKNKKEKEEKKKKKKKEKRKSII